MKRVMQNPVRGGAFTGLEDERPLGVRRVRVLKKGEGERVVPGQLARLAKKAFGNRKKLTDFISPDEWRERRERMVEYFKSALLRPHVERPHEDARVTGAEERGGVRIERILIPSRPGLTIPAVLYLPRAREGKLPGVIIPCGHYAGGKSAPSYATYAATLARNGFAALIYDSFGQGERLVYPDPETRRSLVLGSPTREHCYCGELCFLLGENPIAEFVWDGRRALDCLSSREEVDPERLGCSGQSGGGTYTHYIAIADERVKAAAPVCATGSVERGASRFGSGDAEQVLFGITAEAIDHADLCAILAPRAQLVMNAAGDISQERMDEVMGEIAGLYELLGARDRFDSFRAPGPHALSKEMRDRAYRFFLKHLAGEEREPEAELDMTDPPLATPGGSVYSVGDLPWWGAMARRAEELRRERPIPTREAVRKRLCVPEEPKLSAEIKRGPRIGNLRTEKVVLEPEEGVRVPGVLVLPEGDGPHPACVIAGGWGKDGELAPQGLAVRLAKRGVAAFAVDLRGFGETRIDLPRKGPHFGILGAEETAHLLYVKLGRSYLGGRALDCVAAFRWLAGREGVDPSRTGMVGKGVAALAVMHAAALEGPAAVCAFRFPASYEEIVGAGYYRQPASLFVPGALAAYDVPDLVSLSGAKAFLANAEDARRVAHPREVCQERFPGAECDVFGSEAEFDERCASWLARSLTPSDGGLTIEGRPAAVVPELRRAPRFGKELDLRAWEDVRPLLLGFLDGGGGEMRFPTRVRAASTKEEFFFLFECEERAREVLVTRHKGHDEGCWTDDCVEIFVSPGREATKDYFRLCVTAAGAWGDSLGTDGGEWDIKPRILTSWEDGAWLAQVGVRLSDLGVRDKARGVWRANFFRTRARTQETHAWSPTGTAGCHVPKAFGYLAFDAFGGKLKQS